MFACDNKSTQPTTLPQKLEENKQQAGQASTEKCKCWKELSKSESMQKQRKSLTKAAHFKREEFEGEATSEGG